MENSKTVKIGIVGHGFVGKATNYGFSLNTEKYIVDPLLNTNINGLASFDPKFVFISVPTPMSSSGEQNSKIIQEVIRELSKKCPKSIKIIKSTVLPKILIDLVKYDKKIVYNPEFLREKHANDDFINSSMIILGGPKNICLKVAELYRNHSKCTTNQYIFTDISTASLIKYSINTFLASKVVFFNEMYNLFKASDSKDSWNDMVSAVSKDLRIGLSHLDVPGHDGKYGFGGACFPKDTIALVKYAESLGIDLSVLKTVVKTNNKIRSQYDKLEGRESEQNISFDDKI